MAKNPRVVLLMAPFAGFDRGLLEGISRYTQLHGPWMFYWPNDYPEVPWAASESVGGSIRGQEYLPARGGSPLARLRRWGAAGVIGRILNAATAGKILACGLPAIGIDLPGAKAARTGALARISEIRTDSHQVGRMAAEHFLDRGFGHFAFCGFAGRDWSKRRQEGYCARLQEAGYEIWWLPGAVIQHTIHASRVNLSWYCRSAFAAGAASALGAGILLLASAFPDSQDLPRVLTFVAGICMFGLAMWWDASDRQRITRRADVAFWLHLAAAMLNSPVCQFFPVA